MMLRDPEFTYKQLVQVSRMAQQDDGAKLIGLGAFTSVVGLCWCDSTS
jgi:predicted amino acid dehydrogenase